jgi:hypothetical protein
MPLDRSLPALTLQQPWVELILRGEKTLEVRSLGTRRRGRVLLYASRRVSRHPAAERALSAMGGFVPVTGMVVGSVEILGSRPARAGDTKRACVDPEHLDGQYVWELARPERWPEPVAADRVPYGVWFYPWGRA